ncbi:tetratricopeptide repeat protein, partial [Streptomyces sp. NRRL S-15]|uniref:tetratricopeptide repeat protein n=1 Tax=Streptomyces sp. NRRL S-15 TaxID=1463886 RepID=UPI003B640588
MVFMGDRATLLETGRFVQRRGRTAENMADAAFAVAVAGTADTADGGREAAVLTADIVDSTGAVESFGTAGGADHTAGADTVDHADTADTADHADEAEARHRRAAEAGDTASMSVLGALLLRRGDLDGAEAYLRAATAEGDRAAANNLGVLLHQKGYADEAAGWWRIAAVAGSAAAAHALGRHFRERGDEPGAEYLSLIHISDGAREA